MRPALVSQSPHPLIGGVPCHHKAIAATAPAAISASTAAGWARVAGMIQLSGRHLPGG
jgi:hypothetical protein